MKLKNFAIKVVAALTMAISLASCAGSGPGEHDHVWDGGTVTTAATCHSKGVRTFKCTVEGCAQTKTENIAMTAHNWGDGKVTKEPTCSVPGIRTFTCQNEGCGQSKTEAIPTIAHHYAPGDITKVPDLLEKGERQLVCNVCGDIKKESIPERADYSEQFGLEDSDWMFGYLDSFVVPPEEHPQIDIQPHELELSEGSYKHGDVEFKKNSVSVGATECAFLGYLVPKDTHKLEINFTISFKGKEDNTRVNAYMVLYTEDGAFYANEISEDAKDWTFASEEALDVEEEGLAGAYLSVIFKNAGEGAASGELSGCFTAKCVHTWNEGEVTEAPTETEEGVRTYTCIKCEKTYDEAIEKLPEHDAIKFVQDVNYFPRFDNEDGEIDFAGNAWLTNGGYTVHSEVTKKHETDAYRGGVILDTGVKLVNGHSIELTFESSIKEELGEGESFGLILQHKKFCEPSEISKRIDYLTSPLGDQSIIVDIKEDYKDGENDATLWLALEMGTIENEIVIANVKAVDIGETPVDPLKDYFDFKNKTHDRIDEGYVGKSTLADNNHTLNFEITTPGAHIWEGGVFVETGLTTEAGKSYEVSFEVSRPNPERKNNFEILCLNRQWEGPEEYVKLYTPEGAIDEVFTVTNENAGTLWLYVQSGNAINEISVTKLLIKEVTVHTVTITDTVHTLTETVTEGSEYTLPTWEYAAPAHYSFDHYDLAGAAKNPGDKVLVDADKTINVVWKEDTKYTVDFDANEGTGSIPSVSVYAGDYELPDYTGLVAPAGKYFKGWNIDEDTTLRQPGYSHNVTKNTVVKAIWEQIPVTKYTVTYKSGEGATGDDVVVSDQYGEYTLTDVPNTFTAPTGKLFKCWSVNSEEKAPGATINLDTLHNVTVTAIWDTAYTVSFNGNGATGSMASVTKLTGSTYQLPANGFTAPNGKYFVGWYVGAVETLRDPGHEIIINANVEIKAIWGDFLVFTDKVSPRIDDPVVGSAEATTDGYGVQINITTADTEIYKGGATIQLNGITATGYYVLIFDSDNGSRTKGYNLLVGDTQYHGEYGAAYGLTTSEQVYVPFYAYRTGNYWLTIECGTATGVLKLTNFKLSNYVNLNGVPETRARDGEGDLTVSDNSITLTNNEGSSARWDRGIFINLGNVPSGTYTLSFDSYTMVEGRQIDFKIGYKDFDESLGKLENLENGNHQIEFFIQGTSLWLEIDCGGSDYAGKSITISNIRLVLNHNYYDFSRAKTIENRDNGAKGEFGYDNTYHTKIVSTVTVSGDRAHSGGLINLGTFKAGKYKLTYYSSTPNDNYEYDFFAGFNSGWSGWDTSNKLVAAGANKNGEHTHEFTLGEDGAIWIRFENGGTLGVSETRTFEFYDFTLVRTGD